MIRRILAAVLCILGTPGLLSGCGALQPPPENPVASEAANVSEAPVSEVAAGAAEASGTSQQGEIISSETGQEEAALTVTIRGTAFQVSPADTQAAREFVSMLAEGPVSIALSDYGGFEKVGPIGRSLTASNERITTEPGDIVLYNGDEIVLFYGNNTWEYTPIATVKDLSGWADALGNGDVEAVFSLEQSDTAE